MSTTRMGAARTASMLCVCHPGPPAKPVFANPAPYPPILMGGSDHDH